MLTEGEKSQSLCDFVKVSSRPSEFEMFLRLNGFEEVADAASPNVGLNQYAFAVVRALDGWGLIDGEFFDLLVAVPAKP